MITKGADMNLGEPKCIPEIAEARKPIDGKVQQLTLWQSELPIGAANKILVPVGESPILAICPFRPGRYIRHAGW
jgi:hypothetical protein